MDANPLVGRAGLLALDLDVRLHRRMDGAAAPRGGRGVRRVLHDVGRHAGWADGRVLQRRDVHDDGYGDLVLPPEWRLVGAIEALTGILMCGWSTGFFFAIVSRLFDAGRPPSSVR